MYQKHLDLILNFILMKNYLFTFFFLINSSLLNANENIIFIDMNLILEKSHQGKNSDKLIAMKKIKNNLKQESSLKKR